MWFDRGVHRALVSASRRDVHLYPPLRGKAVGVLPKIGMETASYPV